MIDLERVIKLTQSQYNTLANGGSVGSYTGLDNSFLYLVDGDLYGDVIPMTTNTYNLGSSNNRFKSAYISYINASSIYASQYLVAPYIRASSIYGDNGLSMGTSLAAEFYRYSGWAGFGFDLSNRAYVYGDMIQFRPGVNTIEMQGFSSAGYGAFDLHLYNGNLYLSFSAIYSSNWPGGYTGTKYYLNSTMLNTGYTHVIQLYSNVSPSLKAVFSFKGPGSNTFTTVTDLARALCYMGWNNYSGGVFLPATGKYGTASSVVGVAGSYTGTYWAIIIKYIYSNGFTIGEKYYATMSNIVDYCLESNY